MTENINAEIIAIGTEILLGEITDTNSVHIAKQLRDLGINLYYMTSVGDNEQRIADAIRIALGRADVIITCGGLGPTVDDMTRQGIATAVGRELIFQQDLFDQITDRFGRYKVKMTENNRRQAFLPEAAIPIPNPVGTAPSFIVEEDKKAIISLPGVPREMKFLMKERVIPYLLRKYQLGIIKARILKTAGIGESSLDDMLGDDLLNAANPSIGLAAHHGIIDIRITAKADNEDTADQMLDVMAKQVYKVADGYIFGEGDVQLEPVLIELLRQHGVRMAVVEAGIDNAIIDKLQGLNGGEAVIASAQRFDTPQALREAMQANADYTLRDLGENTARKLVTNEVQASIVILSLPDIDENADVDVGTVVAACVNGQLRSRVYGFGAKNALSRDWVSRWAMSIVWRLVKGNLI